MSVCLSVTLSVNSPTGQTPQWICTVDSLKTQIFARMCLLGVANNIYGSKVYQNQFLGPE